MNTRAITLLIATAALVMGGKAEENNGFPKREQDENEMRNRMMMRRFDKNQDGKLDDEEKAAMEKRHKEVMEKYDKDGDGQLSPEERKAFMEERRKMMGGGKGGPQQADGQPPARQAMDPEKHKKLMEQYDKDGDGKLNDEERRAAFEAHRKRAAGDGANQKRFEGNIEKRKMMMEKFDADGDGKLNDEERQKMREEMEKRMGKPAEKKAKE